METADDQLDKVPQDSENKRPNFFQRLRRSFTNIFRRRNNRKRSKSDSQVLEKGLNGDDPVNLNSSLPDDNAPDVNNEITDANKASDTNFKPPTKVSLPVNDFTSELKQSLQLRSRKIEEGDKSPTEAIKQIEELRTLSSIVVDDVKEDVKIEIESKTFEEKLALFESQISGGSGSVPETLKRNKGDQREGEEDEDEDHNRGNDGCQQFVGTGDEDVCGEVKYTIDMVDRDNNDDDDGNNNENGSIEDDGGSEEYVINDGVGPITNGNESEEEEEEVRVFVKKLIEDASEAVSRASDEDTVMADTGGSEFIDVQ